MYSRRSSQDRSIAQTVTSGRGTVTNPQMGSGHSCLQSQCLLLAKKYIFFFLLLFFLVFFFFLSHVLLSYSCCWLWRSLLQQCKHGYCVSP